MFSTNAKGRSDTVVLKVYTLKDLAEKRTGELYSYRQYFSFTSTIYLSFVVAVPPLSVIFVDGVTTAETILPLYDYACL